MLVYVQCIPDTLYLAREYKDSKSSQMCHSSSDHGVGGESGDAIPFIQLLTPTVFNLSHSALFIDDDTKTSRRRRLFPTCRLLLVEHPWRN